VATPSHRARAPLIAGAVGAAAATLLVLALAGLVHLPDLNHALTRLSARIGPWTYVLVAGFAFAETAAFVGLVAPGETAVALGGVAAAHGDASLPAMIAVAWTGAAAGDFVSFSLGRRLGRDVLVRHGSQIRLTPDRITKVEGFFARHGARTILIGRFIGLVRAVAPFVAGASKLRLREFLPWSLLGTALWSSAFVVIGYAFSSSFEHATSVLAYAALAAAVAAGGWAVVRARRSRTVPTVR
jgi:membrane-associated protein